MKIKIVSILAVGTVLGLFLAYVEQVNADVPMTVDFLTPAETSLPLGPQATLIVTGKSDTTSLGVGCAAPDNYPMQQVVVILPPNSPGSLTHIVRDIILISQTTPLQAGTKLIDYGFLTDCVVDSTSYIKWRATVS